MSKAVAGAAMLAGAATMFALMDFATGGLGAALNTVLAFHIMEALALGGASMEAGAIGDALTSNRGMNITTRTPAALRQIVYGMQRIGGQSVYRSTTGALGAPGNYVYNYIIVLASHQIDSVVNLYLDGRRVFWRLSTNTTSAYASYGANVACGAVSNPATINVAMSGGAVATLGVASGGSGYCAVGTGVRGRVRFVGGGGSGAKAHTTIGGGMVTGIVLDAPGSGYTSAPQVVCDGAYNFGGVAAPDEQDPSQPGYNLGYGIAPDGSHYNFSGKVYCEARFGDQVSGDIMQSLVLNDPKWAPGGSNPYLGGCAYIYLNVGYAQDQFPGEPEIRLTINGKNTILDPRTGKTGFSSNWALCVADMLTDPVWGLGDAASVNSSQLIAAANVCDENVMTSQGQEKRYACHTHYDTSTSPGDALQMMMPAAAGRLSRIGGEWFIWPAYWQGPSFSFDQGALIDRPTWMPNRSFKDLFNRVNGTYIAPNFPYNTAGNLYDQNGWYYGTISNVWPFAWQPTNYPQYACDVLHGYAADEFLIEDGGVVLPREIGHRALISITQAQRVAKIMLLRNRQQGSGSFPMKLGAWAMQPCDVFQMSFAALGWSSKVLEVDSLRFVCEERGDGGDGVKAQALYVQVGVIETDSSVYEWNDADELTPYDVPAMGSQIPPVPPAPTGVAVSITAGTALYAADGTITPRALVSWTAPQDISVVSVDIQYRAHGSSTWFDAGAVPVALFNSFVTGVIAGVSYDFRVCSVRANGVTSAWTEVDSVASTPVFGATGLTPVAPAGTLTAASGSGGSTIWIANFSATVEGFSVACTPSVATLSVATPGVVWYVYYQDASFAGGTITPVATTSVADFQNKAGYFLIGSIKPPTYLPSPHQLYFPSRYVDLGTDPTMSAELPYSGGSSGCWISGLYLSGSGVNAPLRGEVEYKGFPPVSFGVAWGLVVMMGTAESGTASEWAVTASLGGGANPVGQLGTLNARGAWVASRAYAKWDTFTQSSVTYLVVTAYTSGSSFGATDLANTCYLVASGTGATSTTFQSTYPAPSNIGSLAVKFTANAPAVAGSGVQIFVEQIYATQVSW